MNGEFGLNNLNELLEEKLNIENIVFPSVNRNLISREGIKYTFDNGEIFKGRMEGNVIMKSGIYEWPNGQKYKGDFINNNLHKGEITFRNPNHKLIGEYNESDETFKNCIYETETMRYEGNIRRNKFYGKTIIKDKNNENNYYCKGKYDDGIRNGRFEIINKIHDVEYKINGIYRNGKKNGNFKVSNLRNNEIVFESNFSNDIQLLENDNVNEIRRNMNINCIDILNKDSKLILLFSSERTLYIYDILEQKYLEELELFDNGRILDILVLKDKNILISNDDNKFKLIDIKINRRNSQIRLVQNRDISLSNITYNIFSLLELDNNLIVSGGNTHLIFWKKNFSIINDDFNNNIINQNENSIIRPEGKNIWDTITKCFNNYVDNVLDLIHGDQETEISRYNLENIFEMQSSPIYSFLEIKNQNQNQNFILAVAQPNEKKILILNLSFNNNNIIQKKVNTINNIDTIIGRKNIMTYKNNILYVGCTDCVKLIDVDRAEIINYIILEKISFINIYRNEFLFLGINRKITAFDFESKLIQYKNINNEINPLFENYQHRHNGSIINNLIFYHGNKEYIISLGTDKKIIITYSNYNFEENEGNLIIIEE